MRRLSKRIDPDLIFILLLLAFGLAAYSNSFLASFHYDDLTHIAKNDAISDLGNVARIYSYCKERFLTYLTLALNYKLSALDPVTYHIFNFFIHYIAACFIYFLFRDTWETVAMEGRGRASTGRLAALLAAGIFLLHPLQTQAVTYVIQRAESMAGMFYLGALLFYVRARLASTRHASTRYYTIMILCAVAAAFSKETAVTLPVAIMAYEVFFFKTRIQDLLRSKFILIVLVPAVIIVIYKLGPLLGKNFYYDYDPNMHLSRKQYFLTQLSVLVTYLRLFLWPANQNLDWDYPIASNLFNVRTITSLFLLLSLIFVAIVAYRQYRILSFGIICFFLTLAPTSSIIPIKDVIYEHRMYLAVGFLAMGLVEVINLGFSNIKQVSSQVGKIALLVVSLITLPLLAGATHARNEVWRSEVSLWRDVVKKSPNKARAHNNYGMALYMVWRQMSENAKQEFEIASRLSPNWEIPYYNLAIAAYQEGDYQRAVALYRKAIELKPNYKEAIYQLGKTYIELNRWEDARPYLELLIMHSPTSKYLGAYLDLLDVYLKIGLRDKASALAMELTRMSDSLQEVDYYRGKAFFRLSDYERAKTYFARQIERESEQVSSILMLGYIHYLEEDYKEAEATFRRALEEYSWSVAGHYNLALILARSDRYTEAVAHLEKAIAADSFSLAPRYQLIRLYGHLGNKRKQLDLLRKLLGLRPDSAEFIFLEANLTQDLRVTLGKYKDQFIIEDGSCASQSALAIIATIMGEFQEAIERYNTCLKNLTVKRARQRIIKEVNRLEAVLQDKELLLTPV